MLTGLLRDELGYDGLVMTDSLEMGALATTGYPVPIAAATSLKAGADVLLISHGLEIHRQAHAMVLDWVRRGEIPEARLDAAVRRVLETKERFGLLDEGQESGVRSQGSGDRAPAAAGEQAGSAEHKALSRQVAAQGITLLRDDAHLLPLKPGAKLLVIEPPAAAGIGAALGGTAFTVAANPTAAEIATAVGMARDGRTVVVATADAKKRLRPGEAGASAAGRESPDGGHRGARPLRPARFSRRADLPGCLRVQSAGAGRIGGRAVGQNQATGQAAGGAPRVARRGDRRGRAIEKGDRERRERNEMAEPTLIIMAGGIGSRYGGLKQIDPIGPSGEIIVDYSVYDALRAGFGKVVFLIRRDIEDAFREKIGRAVEKRVDTAYVFQDIEDIPPGCAIPPGRTKPWGTGHAVLCCHDVVDTPFAAINADDFYGATAYQTLAAYLRGAHDRAGVGDYCLVGYALRNTLSEHGSVARGTCEVTPDGYLVDLRERTRIQRFSDGIKYSDDGVTWVSLPEETVASMNLWGFTPGFFGELEARFPAFFRRNAATLGKAEFLLPNIVGEMAKEGAAKVKVLATSERWFGMTYREDRSQVQAAILQLIRQGIYPERLWAD